MVIDYRKINEDTDEDAYPLPVVDDVLDQLGRAKFFPAFDLAAGFHQIPMKEPDKKYTAFSTSQGHFEYNRMPFGLKNAPPKFQRMKDNAFRGLIGTRCFAYINDIVIFGKTIQKHNENLEAVLESIKTLGLRLELSQNGHPCLFISRTLNKARKIQYLRKRAFSYSMGYEAFETVSP